MALLWIDGFDKYGPSGSTIDPGDIVDWKYKGHFDERINVEAGRYSGNCIVLDDLSTYLETPDIGNSGSDTIIVGFAFKMRDLDNTCWLVDLRHPGADGETVGYGQLTFKIGGGGNGSNIYVNLGNTTLNSTANGPSPNFLTVNTWYYFEAKVKCHSSNGTINCYINGVELLTYTGNTQHRSGNLYNTYSRVMWHTTEADELYIDDLYIADDTGSGVTDVLGECRVETLSPTSDASGNWTPNTGNSLYAVIDENTQDSNYISETTSGNQALFEITDLSSNAATGTVKGVMLNCESQQISRFNKYAKAITQNGSGNTIQDTGHFMPGRNNPLNHSVIMESDPDGNAWTPATVNQLRIGVELS